MRAPPSLKKMVGSKDGQEGNYASLDLSRLGMVPLQNDLGLTLLPGSQIEKVGEETFEIATWNGLAKCHIAQTYGCTNNYVAGTESLCINDETSHFSDHDGKALAGAPESDQDRSQTLQSFEGNQDVLAENQWEQLERRQKPSSRGEQLQWFGDSKLRYYHRVRGLKNAPEETRRRIRRKVETSPVPNGVGEHRITILTSSSDSIISQTEKNDNMEPSCESNGQPPNHALQSSQNPTGPPSLPHTEAKQKCLQTLTSFYPQCSKPRFASVRNFDPNNQYRRGSTKTFKRRSFVTGKLADVSPDKAYGMMQAELRETRTELFRKTRVESDAQHTAHLLNKAHDDLQAKENAHLKLQKVYSKLLSEHRRLLESYDGLAKAHASCRKPSSRKLAQRIVDAAPPSSNKPSYPSPSPSITAPSAFTSRANSHAAIQTPCPATPTIDLTRSPSPQVPVVVPSCAIATPGRELGNCSSYEQLESSNYANMNGFDDEANELFNALWENEMATWDAGRDGEMVG